MHVNMGLFWVTQASVEGTHPHFGEDAVFIHGKGLHKVVGVEYINPLSSPVLSSSAISIDGPEFWNVALVDRTGNTAVPDGICYMGQFNSNSTRSTD